VKNKLEPQSSLDSLVASKHTFFNNGFSEGRTSGDLRTPVFRIGGITIYESDNTRIEKERDPFARKKARPFPILSRSRR
jgi:hypothetical protein